MSPDFPYSVRTFTHSVIKYNERGFFEIYCTDEHVFEVDDVIEIHEYFKSCSDFMHEKVLVVSYAARLNIIGIDSMRYLSTGPHAEFILAEAFVISSLPQRILGNFYLNNFKPIVPAKVFTNKEEAREWLLGFRSNNGEFR